MHLRWFQRAERKLAGISTCTVEVRVLECAVQQRSDAHACELASVGMWTAGMMDRHSNPWCSGRSF